MPPALHVASSTGLVDAGSVELVTPASAKARDTLLAIFALPSSNDGPDLDATDADEWEAIAALDTGTLTLWILRREAEAGDSSGVSIPLLDNVLNPHGAALVVLRNLDPSAAPRSSSVTAHAAATSFPTPSRTLAAYSDLFLGVVYLDSNEATVTPPAGATKLVEYQGDGHTLSVFAYWHESTGATGTKIATTAGAEDGLAASIALAADSLVGFGKSFTVEPRGAIGLPSEGV